MTALVPDAVRELTEHVESEGCHHPIIKCFSRNSLLRSLRFSQQPRQAKCPPSGFVQSVKCILPKRKSAQPRGARRLTISTVTHEWYFQNMPVAPSDPKRIEKLLTTELDELRPGALAVASDVNKREVSTQTLHAIIGGKNNTYVNSVTAQFTDPEDFLARWTKGLLEAAMGGSLAARRLVRIIKHPTGRAYAFTFLKRTFYRQYAARVRPKPPENLWEIWFGGNSHEWGLFISPVFRKGVWKNDKSEMRKASYAYWTVGHVLQTGLISPGEQKPYEFESVDELAKFYRYFLKKVSNSAYEKGVADRYLSYLKTSQDIFNEPFLIPEFRYAGVAGKHKHRLDYTVFNGHTMTITGFELSPHSTHGAIKTGTNQKGEKKTLKAFNEESSAKWESEMGKRNAYFLSYNVPIVTFTDSSLVDLDQCFSYIRKQLSDRPPDEQSLSDSLRALTASHF